jgi:hypothetical protein
MGAWSLPFEALQPHPSVAVHAPVPSQQTVPPIPQSAQQDAANAVVGMISTHMLAATKLKHKVSVEARLAFRIVFI